MMKEFYKGKRVVITGNTGFKGSWMAHTLKFFGADAVGISLKPETTPSMYEILNQGLFIKENIVDIRDYDRVRRIFDDFEPEIVFHLAAQPLVLDSYKNPRYTYDVNVMGTVNVCECVRKSKSVCSFVNITTDKVYRNNEWEYPYRELDALDGYDPYSNSKSCSELVTASYVRSFFSDRKLPVSTCRAGNVIGGGDFSNYRIIPDCYRNVVSGRVIGVRNPNSVRPYQYVLEAIMFYLYLGMRQTESYEQAGSYNIGPEFEDCLSTAELCDLFCENWGSESSWELIPTNELHEANLLRLDISKAKSKLGWKPLYNIKDAVKETVLWYKAYIEGENMSIFTDKQIEKYYNTCYG